jgi:hypothetical protein
VPHKKKAPLQIRIQNIIPFFWGDFLNSFISCDAGIVDQDIDSAKMFQTSGYDLSHIPLTSNISNEAQNILPLPMPC